MGFTCNLNVEEEYEARETLLFLTVTWENSEMEEEVKGQGSAAAFN